jgi:aldehyde:ferredoxin oxidoreductase
MMKGWKGKILYVDLTTRSFRTEKPPIELYERFIGGKGLAGYYLRPFITLPYDAPEMPLLFFTGPLVDTPSPTSGRMSIMSRSPLTGTVGDTSVGGKLGTAIKRAGYDGIIINGKCDNLCGLKIINNTVEITDAKALSDKNADEIPSIIGGDGSVACTGPAAEHGVLYSCIMIDGHYSSGRGGLGLVMASKNLKYIQVSGNEKTSIHNPGEIALAREEIFRLTSASPILQGELGISNFGTGALYDLISVRGMMPTDNFRATRYEHADEMNAFRYRERYRTKRTGCMGCHILCKKKGENGEIIPEFETMSHFSALIGNTDIDTVVKANQICNQAGMDTISAAVTISCMQEISGEKLNPGSVLSLLNDIAYSRGKGEELKLGSYRYALTHGMPDTSISVKALELPAYDPRGAYGMALAYATSTRGGCHLRAYPVSHEILRKPVATDRFTFSGKARIIKISEDLNAVIDSLTACKFLFFAASLEEFARAYYGVTGVKTTAQDLLKIGERIYYHDRIMNSLNGFTSQHDDLPARFFTNPGTDGDGFSIPAISRADFLQARSDYYMIRGLDVNGMPVKGKAEELGLEWNSI